MKSSIVFITALLSISVISCQKEAIVSNSQKLTLDGLASSSNKTVPVPKSITIKDVSGNSYKVVTIGTQKWIASNLNTSKYRNGDPIPEVKDPVAWSKLTTGAWCYYNNDPANASSYGKLYNWYAINDPRGVAPKGWHIPTTGDWTILTNFLGGVSLAGLNLKSTLFNGTNSSGFNALMGGYRNEFSSFLSFGQDGLWWSATSVDPSYAWVRNMYKPFDRVGEDYGNKKCALAVRCIKD